MTTGGTPGGSPQPVQARPPTDIQRSGALRGSTPGILEGFLGSSSGPVDHKCCFIISFNRRYPLLRNNASGPDFGRILNGRTSKSARNATRKLDFRPGSTIAQHRLGPVSEVPPDISQGAGLQLLGRSRDAASHDLCSGGLNGPQQLLRIRSEIDDLGPKSAPNPDET